jgi:hypothetical protein
MQVTFSLTEVQRPTRSPCSFSQIYEWDGASLSVVAEFPTCGGTDVAVLEGGDEMQLAVSNSLDANVRFAGETVLYALSTKPV